MNLFNVNDLLTDELGFVTVMDVCVLELVQNKKYGSKEPLTPADFSCNSGNVLFLNTLKLSNIKESGPAKSFKVGLPNIPLIRSGKTVTVQITDALTSAKQLMKFFGLKLDGSRIYSNNQYAKLLVLEGKTKVITLKNEIKDVYIFMPCFLPTGNLELSMDAAGDFGVFDLSGQLFPVYIQTEGNEPHTEFYSIGYESFLSSITVDEGDTVQIASIDYEEVITHMEAREPIYNREEIIIECNRPFPSEQN